jgi:rhomboid protease GluP
MSGLFRAPSRYNLTYILIALNVVAYAYTSFLSGNPIITSDEVLRIYGQNNTMVMQGWFFQLFTAMFVHVNSVHLIGNMFFLLIFGLRAEELFHVEEYVMIYLLTGLAGNLLTLLLGPWMISAGASGAIFGLFGAVATYVRRAVGQSIVTALAYSFFLLIISTGVGVNILAHLGGLVAGLLIGYLLGSKRQQATSYQVRYTYP